MKEEKHYGLDYDLYLLYSDIFMLILIDLHIIIHFILNLFLL